MKEALIVDIWALGNHLSNSELSVPSAPTVAVSYCGCVTPDWFRVFLNSIIFIFVSNLVKSFVGWAYNSCLLQKQHEKRGEDHCMGSHLCEFWFICVTVNWELLLQITNKHAITRLAVSSMVMMSELTGVAGWGLNEGEEGRGRYVRSDFDMLTATFCLTVFWELLLQTAKRHAISEFAASSMVLMSELAGEAGWVVHERKKGRDRGPWSGQRQGLSASFPCRRCRHEDVAILHPFWFSVISIDVLLSLSVHVN